MEIKLFMHVALVVALVAGGIRAAAARDRRSLLFGSVLTTVGVIGSLWISEISAIAVLLAIVFIVFDFMVFAFSGATKILPAIESGKKGSGRLYASFVVWLLLTVLVSALYLIWRPGPLGGGEGVAARHQSMITVLNSLWNQDGFPLYLLVALIFATAIGSFFMIEQEEE